MLAARSRQRSTPRTRRGFVMLPALLIVAVLIPLPARGCELRTVAEHTVAAVIDGQSVRLDNGDEVRLADILAPSASDAASGPAQGAIPVMSDATAWPLAARAQQELAQLVLGRTVQLAVASETGGAQLDRYGRRQAHLQVHRPDGKIWLQAHLLSGGFVRLAYAPGATPRSHPKPSTKATTGFGKRCTARIAGA